MKSVLSHFPGALLLRILVRPAVLALASVFVLLFASGQTAVWPYAMVGGASLLGLWEGYSAVIFMLRSSALRRTAGGQLQVCLILLILALANLALLNASTQMAHPGTFEWRGQPASVLDVVYLTLLTFASSGYGDVLPATPLGKVLSMLTSFAGLVYATIFSAALWQQLAPDKPR